MKILAVSAFFPPDTVGGYEWAAHAVLSRLSARKHEVTVLAGRPEKNITETDCGCDVRRTLRRVQIWNNKQTFGAKFAAFMAYIENYREIYSQIKRVNPDVIYCWAGATLTPAIIAAFENSNKPVIFHLEDTWLESARRQTGVTGFTGLISKALRGLLTGLPKYEMDKWGLIYVSRSLQKEYQEAGWNTGLEKVVHNGFSCDLPPRNWLSEKPEGPWRIGFAGRLRRNKGISELLAALDIVSNSIDWRLDICGTGDASLETELKLFCEEKGLSDRVSWRGALSRNELQETYREMDLLVVPSTWKEPFGLVAIESLAAGVPVLASNRGGLAEIITEQCGWTVDPTPGTLAYGLREALNNYNLLSKKGIYAHKRFTDTFLWEDKIEKIEACLIDMIRDQ